MPIRKKLDDVAGKVCEAVLPIKYEYCLGRGGQVAVCTLSSIDLLEEICGSDLMNRIAIAGRLLSENRGIDAMIQFTLEHPELRRIIICGKEVKGHRAGQALLSLAKNGVDQDGRIIAAGPHSVLKSSARDVDAFRRQVEILDMTGMADVGRIAELVS